MKRSLSTLLSIYRIFKSVICKQKICTLVKLWDYAYIHRKSTFTHTHTIMHIFIEKVLSHTHTHTHTHTFQSTTFSKVHQE